MFTLLFWKAATERAAKSAAQGVLVFWGVGDGILNAWDADWQGAGGVAVGMAVVSYLTSIISGAVSERGTPSLGPETLKVEPTNYEPRHAAEQITAAEGEARVRAAFPDEHYTTGGDE